MNQRPLDAPSAPAFEPAVSSVPVPGGRRGDFGDHLRRAGSTAPTEPAASAGETVQEDPTAALKSTRRKAGRIRKTADQTSHKRDEQAAALLGQRADPTAVKINNPRQIEMANAFRTAQAEAVQGAQPQNAVDFDVASGTAETANSGESSANETDLLLIVPSAELIDSASLARALAPESTETDPTAGNRTLDMPPAIAASTLDMKISAEQQPGEVRGTTGGPRAGKAGQAAVELADTLSRMLAAQIGEVNAAAPLASLDAPHVADEASQQSTMDGPPDTAISPDGAASSDPNTAGLNAVEPPRPRSIGASVGGTAASHPSSANHDPQLEVDRIRFVQRISRAFQSLGNSEGQIRLRLSPPSLGALTLEVTLRGGELVARMETETAAAKNLLLDNLPALRERLSQHEVRIARFEVDLADHTGGGRGGEHALPDARPHRDGRPGRHGDPTLTAAATPPRRPRTNASQANLDVII